MRRAAFIFLAAFVLLGVAPAEKKIPVRDATGLEWLEMSVGARTDAIIAAMIRLTQDGVPLAYPPDEYYNAVHLAIRRDPSLNDVPVTSLVALHAYDHEPETRPAIDALRVRRATAVR